MTPVDLRVARRQFLSGSSCLVALYGIGQVFPLPAIAAPAAQDPRIGQAPIADAGYASVRKVGNGLYATISDTSKGRQATCNGGFLCGKDASLLIEAFATPEAASFQFEALQHVSQAPPAGALNTHYHWDHALGNSFYATRSVQIWSHPNVPKRMLESYEPMQGGSKETFIGPLEKRVADAKSETQKEHAQGDLRAASGIYDVIRRSFLTLPNRPLDRMKLPLNVDLGALAIVVETFPGHSGTDVIVRVPDQKVVYTGDLLFNGTYPACFDAEATISGWRSTLKTFAGYEKDTIFVPGHGAVCGQEGVALLTDIFDDIADQAQKLFKAGVPPGEAADRYVIPEKLKKISVFAWGFTIGPAITKLYAEWSAK